MNYLKGKAIILVLLLALILTPAVVYAEAPEPAPPPYPEEWQIEYKEWLAFQYESQQEYANETEHGLGVLLDFIDWAPMREAYGPYWWKPGVTSYFTRVEDGQTIHCVHLYVEAYA